MLSRCHEFLNAVGETNKSTEKILICKRFQDVKPLLALIINPQHTTGITAAQVKQYEIKQFPKFPNESFDNDIMSLMEKLIARKLTGDRAKEAVVHLLNLYPAFRDSILKIVEKKLKIGMQLKQINKAFNFTETTSENSETTKPVKKSNKRKKPDDDNDNENEEEEKDDKKDIKSSSLVTEYKIPLANDYAKQINMFQKSITNGETWYISRKLDGVRCQIFTHHGCFSRTGNKFTSTDTLEKMINECTLSGFVLDGEMCVIEHDKETRRDIENFQKAVSAIRKKNQDLGTGFRVYVFDLLTREEFIAGKSHLTLSQRWDRMTLVLKDLFERHSHHFQPVEQVFYNEKNFEKMQQTCKENNWEGLMLRKDTLYKAKRSNDLLKVKTFQSNEYVVQDVQNGTKTILNHKTRKMEECNVLSAVKIRHLDRYDVWVGSGFTDEQRLHYYQHPEDILGKTIEVQYFEETQNKNGDVSLRFPTIKCIYENGRDT